MFASAFPYFEADAELGVSLALLFSCLGIHLDWRKKTWGRTQGLTKGTDPLKIGDLDIEWREKKGEEAIAFVFVNII